MQVIIDLHKDQTQNPSDNKKEDEATIMFLIFTTNTKPTEVYREGDKKAILLP